jgi:hypothetical protein
MPIIPRPLVPAAPSRAPHGIEIVPATDDYLQGLLCVVETREGGAILAYINIEHPWIQDAMSESPPNRFALAHCIAVAMAPVIQEHFKPQLLRHAAPALRDRYETLTLEDSPSIQELTNLAVRILIDHYMAGHRRAAAA